MLMAAMIPLEKVVLGKEKDDELSCRKVRLESLSYIPIWESVQRFEASHQRKIVKQGLWRKQRSEGRDRVGGGGGGNGAHSCHIS